MADREDPYVYEGTDVLINTRDLRDGEELAAFERRRTTTAIARLRQEPVPGNFDAEHLQTIHREIFGSVYPFAGEPRTIELDKPEIVLNGESVAYARPGDELRNDLASATKRVQAFHWNDQQPAASAREFAEAISEVWKAHPFREGNTRAVSVYMEQFSRERGFELDVGTLTKYPSELRDAFVKASAEPPQPRALAAAITEAREMQIQREHPVIGKLTSEAAEVLGYYDNPSVRRLPAAEAARGQVITTSYNTVLVQAPREILAVDLARFPEQPANNERVRIAPAAEQAQDQSGPGFAPGSAEARLKEFVENIDTRRGVDGVWREGLRQVEGLKEGFDARHISNARLLAVAKAGAQDRDIEHILHDGYDPIARHQIATTVTAIGAGKASHELNASDIRTAPLGEPIEGAVLANAATMAAIKTQDRTIYVGDRVDLSNDEALRDNVVTLSTTGEGQNAQAAKLFGEISQEDALRNETLAKGVAALREFDRSQENVPDGPLKDAARAEAIDGIKGALGQGVDPTTVQLAPEAKQEQKAEQKVQQQKGAEQDGGMEM